MLVAAPEARERTASSGSKPTAPLGAAARRRSAQRSGLRARRRAAACGLWLAFVASFAAAELPPLRGLPLERALAILEEEGLSLVYSSELVKAEMTVRSEPTTHEPRQALEQLLREHGLAALEAPGGVLVVVAVPLPATGRVRGTVRSRAGEALAGATISLQPGGAEQSTTGGGSFDLTGLAAGRYLLTAAAPGHLPQSVQVAVGAVPVVLEIELEPTPTSAESIDVLSHPGRVPGEELSAVTLRRDEALALPTVGEDVFRSLWLLPGTTRSELSARPQIRGGRDDEVLVRLDGLELLEAYHLKDFDSALSIVAGPVLGEVSVYSGGYPVEFGERMSGVVDLSSVGGSPSRRTALGAGAFQAQASHSRQLFGGRGQGFVNLRLGYLQLPLQAAEEPDDPRFWDLFVKIDRSPSANRNQRVNLLLAGDELGFDEGEGADRESFETAYGNRYLWMTEDRLVGRLFLESRLSWSGLETERTAESAGEEGNFSVRDRRRLSVPAFAHDALFDTGDLQQLKWGFDVRYHDVAYDYANQRRLVGPLARLRDQSPRGETFFEEDFHGYQLGTYFADRLSWPRVSLELGLRLDENTVTDDEHASPRLDLAWSPGEATRLRLAWGYFYQGQRLYELQVEDGATDFQPAERAEHRILGLQHRFREGRRRPLTLRLELYERRIANPRIRYENLVDPVSKVPELEADRVRVEADSSRAQGFELFLGGSAGPVDWFTTYTLSRVEDRIEGRRVPRPNDQPQAFAFDLSYRAGRKWDFNLALQARSGWPTTRIGATVVTAEDGSPEIRPVLGPLYAERLDVYGRIDLQARRRWQVRRGELELALSVHNLTNRHNVRGFELDFGLDPQGRAVVEAEEKAWAGLLPAFDLTWRF